MSLDITLYYPVETDSEDDCMHVVWERNVTHNLGRLADALGVYEIIWRPEETDGMIECADDMVPPLEVAISVLLDKFDEYKKYEPENGWGTRNGFIRFMRGYLEACHEFPNALIKASR